MKRLAPGILLATIAAYFWGFLYWGLNPLPYSVWKQTHDDEAAQQALREHFPESGTYYLPGMYNDEDTLSRLSEAGPVGFVHISLEGRPVVQPETMAKGFVLTLVSVIIAATILQLASLPSYGQRLKLAVLVGLAGAVMIDLGQSVWWHISWAWKLQGAIYDLTVWVVIGLVLAKFIRPETEPRTVVGSHGMTRIEDLRRSLVHGKAATQSQLDAVIAELAPAKPSFRPTDKVEPLPLYDHTGKELKTQAPRWLCHVLALRHRCAHVLLVWHSPKMGDALVLQIRSWDKDDSPGRVDISVGGHMTATDSSAEKAAFAEILQETGLQISDLEDPEDPLEYVGGYPFDEERPDENFFNSEWRDVYVATVRPDRFGSIRFPDGEVAGIVVVPLNDAGKLLTQEIVPMASGLKKSLPKCLEHLR